jgi:NADH:ubiquinone oxidoreductase subunit
MPPAMGGKRVATMGINLNPFTWWTGASWGTILYGLRGKTQVGEDSLGNTYWEGGRDTAGNPRRWVIYAGANDTSRVPPEWFSWLHHQIEAAPDRSLPAPRTWEKPSVPNLTGTALAYRPQGALEKGGHRAAATGDYEAWSPEG